ncbi:up-regulator of cell proliferation-like [Ambystoma mexicanum]|uniref:up-regulator of cell proliferation-like n=1 Tax=Ambystoma mexicanum TaxID=8296 RepID=UPI0037E8DC18
MLSERNLKNYGNKQLTLRAVLETGPENLESECLALEDMPWNFLKKLLALNATARNTSLKSDPQKEEGDAADNDIFGDGALDGDPSICSINHLDVLCVLLHCCDSFLQQEIMLKMSMCHFALPIILPPVDGSECTFMLWAMRDIVRKWRPQSLRDSKGFREESLVLTPMATFSFVRLGSCSLSKSKILNEVLSPRQQHHDFFIHRDMECGNISRGISDGLVEISWYFPGGRENSDVFPEPVAVMNLRGDIKRHGPQFRFLTEISSAVFIFIENNGQQENELLSSLKSHKKYYVIVNSQTKNNFETVNIIKRLVAGLKMAPFPILKKGRTINDATFAKKLQSILLGLIKIPPKTVNVEDMAVVARELGIRVDEDCKECQSGKKCAKDITECIGDIVEYKKKTMKLQGEPWKKLAKIEKKFCRLKRQGKNHTEDYKLKMRAELSELRRKQNECELTEGLITFISGVGGLPKVEKQYFLKWMKFELDSIARRHLSDIRCEYKEKSEDSRCDPKELADLARRISASSLGVEHFMREMGQFYEAEYSMIKEGKVKHTHFSHLPGIAADLLLEGFPLELIDGDASNIPLQWVTDVLTELHTKLGGRCRMVVITVLGVQSTGKSTLLNTMFGLQFSVSSGRCTRGAFMLLMKVKENLRQELGCDFILVIDTKGLKAPELMTLENSYEHDSELATLVIGLSDITIVNMSMETATEMKDILQIVVQTFLRMEKIGKRTNCQFVHQNVSDISAHGQNMRHRKRLLDQLNTMTKAAAKMEKQNEKLTFSDVMEYDPNKHNWYIPGLWHGVPPMASVNMGYSEHVHELKQYLFEFIRDRAKKENAMDIPQFKEWLKSLWNAIKHENFIFSFRNSLVAEAYNQLSMTYSEWEWAFRKEMHLWVSEKENVIQNQTLIELSNDTFKTFKQESFQKVLAGEKNILDSLNNYFESGGENLNLIERYKEDFIRSAKGLRNELEDHSLRRLEEAIQIQKGKHKLKELQDMHIKITEERVVRLLEECRKREVQMGDEELKEEFEKMWEQTLSELQLQPLQIQHVRKDMLLVLKKDLDTLGVPACQMLQNTNILFGHGKEEFMIRNEHFDLPLYRRRGIIESITHECKYKTEELVKSLVDSCSKYISDKVYSKVDYDETHCRELLKIINDRLQEQATKKLHITSCFKVELKLHILGMAAPHFQRMHENYIKENDPILRLDTFKAQYFSTFKDLYLEKDACQKRARDFCDQCLKPALVDHIYKRLGIEVVDDILSSEKSVGYSSRMSFQYTVLDWLLKENNFENYVKYIKNYVDFIKHWIWSHILDHYKGKEKLRELQQNILSVITKKMSHILNSTENFNTISALLEHFCEILKEDLVISKDTLQVIIFQNTDDVVRFSADVQYFLSQMKSDILSEFKASDIQATFSKLALKPQNEIFQKVFGCGKQCPFCKAPCEA